MLDLSVVIPTYNRCETLLRCLDALNAQTLERSRYEIVLVDDGSTDQTAAMMSRRDDVRFYQQRRNAGPAAARNVGIREARGRLILFLGDDIIARPRLLEQHLAAHEEVPGDHVAVLGYAPWAQQIEVTPFMRYLLAGCAFPQFEYEAICNPDNVPVGYFYTCNISLSRSFLLAYGLFDEEFRQAYGEDTELAYRLSRHGLRIIFRRLLVADHWHPTTYASVRRRAHVAGGVALLIAQKHPELADLSFLRFSARQKMGNWAKRRLVELMLDPLLELADQRRWDHPLLARLYGWVLNKQQLWGLLDALQLEQTALRASAVS